MLSKYKKGEIKNEKNRVKIIFNVFDINIVDYSTLLRSERKGIVL